MKSQINHHVLLTTMCYITIQEGEEGGDIEKILQTL